MGISSIQFDTDTKYLAAGITDGSIEIYNLFTGELSYALNRDEKNEELMPTFLEIKYPVTCLRWRPGRGLGKKQSVLVNASPDGSLRHWHATSGKLLHSSTETGNGIYCLDYSAEGNKLVTGGSDTKIRLYDDEAHDLVTTFSESSEKLVSHFNRVFSVKFDPSDDHLIYSGGWDKVVNVNDTRVKTPVAQIEGPYLSADTIDVINTNLLVGNYRTGRSGLRWF